MRGIVERRDPVLAEARGPALPREQPLLRFHYRLLQPHRTAIERGELGRVMRTMSEDLRAFIAVLLVTLKELEHTL